MDGEEEVASAEVMCQDLLLLLGDLDCLEDITGMDEGKSKEADDCTDDDVAVFTETEEAEAAAAEGVWIGQPLAGARYSDEEAEILSADNTATDEEATVDGVDEENKEEVTGDALPWAEEE